MQSIVIANKNIPDKALNRLKKQGKVILLETKGITYPAVSGHPDIFFCRVEETIVVSPNLPETIINQLKTLKLSFVYAETPTGSAYPATSGLNAVVTSQFIMHNENHTDPVLVQLTSEKQFIHVKQGYTRCNLIPLKNNRFITSDKGIEKTLKKKGLDVLYVEPKSILLPGFEHGFIGGTCGVSGDTVFFIGTLNRFPDGGKIRNFLRGYQIVELYNGPLFDGGSLIFIE